jgi:hypothetical protein
MTAPNRQLRRLLETIVEHIGVPKSYYEKAAARHRSLAEFLHRDGSTIADLDPDIRPQGSFRYGTVNRPILDDEEYDLDNVCLLRKLSKSLLTQEQLKNLYGEEIRAYAKANGMVAPVEEHNRCWRLRYADEVRFHLDTLPCVPETGDIVRLVEARLVSADLARRAVGITDKRRPEYCVITQDWLSSNPRGFAVWFEGRAALGRRRSVTENALRASIEDVPPYEWKTTLQLSIQILKRHRDVMFRKQRDLAPISMIVTNLASHAYNGESDLLEALENIVEKMPAFVRPVAPRVPNPADPAEDYADKWSRDSRLEKSFWDWHAAVTADLENLSSLLGRPTLKREVQTIFQVDLTQEEEREFGSGNGGRPVVPAKAAPTLIIPSASRPWGHHG